MKQHPLNSLNLNSSTLNVQLKLRDYQQDLANKIESHWNTGRLGVLAQSPTGSGKRVIFTYLALKALEIGESILVIVPKIELLNQAIADLETFSGVSVGIIKYGIKSNPFSRIQVATIQSLTKRKLPKADLVILDEAHHAAAPTYSKIIASYRQQGAKILGLTATPLRVDGRGLRYLHEGVLGFDALVTGESVKSLTEQGYLCPFKIFAGSNLLDPKAAGIATKAGDYSQSELEDYAGTVLLTGEIVDTWEKHALGKRTVLYPVSVELSKQYCQQFLERGYPAAHIDANTSEIERSQIIERFKGGSILILCQHSIVIEGVDIPLIECVQFARPTKSLTVWFQSIGRALRPAEGKEHAIVIDHTTTHLELPWVDDEIEWSLDPISIPEGKGVINCSQCCHGFRPTLDEKKQSWATCPNCQTKFRFEIEKGKGSKKSRVVETLPADLQEFIQGELNPEVVATMDRLFELVHDRGYQKSWVFFKLVKEHPDVGFAELRELAKKLGYQPGWAYYKHLELRALAGGEK